jgi:hypothetical protein
LASVLLNKNTGYIIKIRLRYSIAQYLKIIEELMGQIKKTSLKKDRIRGRYANFFKVGHNAYEFVIDFCQYFPSNGTCPENEKAELCQRFIISSAYAKGLLKVIQQSIEEYEKAYGIIDE